jgi:hypothetical protein
MPVSHLQMFYETRQSVFVSDSNPSNSPNTELNRIPTAATIRYEDYPDRSLDAEEYSSPDGKGYEIAKLLIGRAMLDPDAVVVPE